MESKFQLSPHTQKTKYIRRKPSRAQSPYRNLTRTLSSRVSNPKNPAQFINITSNSTSLDESSRKEVRKQVMVDYHRRRIEKPSGKEVASSTSGVPLTAKAQTRKFRLQGEEGLRVWQPRKAGGGKSSKSSAFTSTTSRLEVAMGGSGFDRMTDGAEVVSSDDKTEGEKNAEDFETGQADIVLDQDLIFEELDDEDSFHWISTDDLSLPPPLLQRSVSPGAFDPFASTSLIIQPRTQYLIHYYFNIRLRSSWLMMPIRKSLFCLAIHDKALFHTFLSHYAASYNARFEARDPAESVYHRTMAMKIVNERLEDPAQALSDGTIAAVANLAIYESANGELEDTMAHLDGLEKMVNLRGGLLEGGFAPYVLRLIGWTDLNCASALSQKPRFQTLNFAHLSPQMIQDHELDSQEYDEATSQTNFFYTGNTTSLPHLDKLLTQLREFTTTVQKLTSPDLLPPRENLFYSDKIYHFQHQLFTIIHSSPSFYTSLDKACSIVALLFCCYALKDIPFTFRIFTKGVERLKILVALHEENSKGDDGVMGRNDGDEIEVKRKLFWAVGLGALAAEGKDEWGWFVERIREMCVVMGVDCWDKARSILESVLWQNDLNEAGERLWKEANLDNILESHK
ncbi:hypothetical protein G7Y89_g6916 [Cudoniella acicularis]|uniref:Uncharacterized protein n=1 Tax=Cudoniella acicularis TaxID=354080 RepID=A0A8H4RLU2_9HELO|nr:hypothetical protein G7Y89_g6916 [Cudoniella acicularis]